MPGFTSMREFIEAQSEELQEKLAFDMTLEQIADTVEPFDFCRDEIDRLMFAYNVVITAQCVCGQRRMARNVL